MSPNPPDAGASPPAPAPCSNSKNNGEAAECWLAFGFQVIPIVPSIKKPAALWDPWLNDFSPDKVKRHWYQYPHHDVGFILDESIINFDCDTPESVAVLNKIEREIGVSSNLIIKTKRGEHHYFRRAPGTYAKSDSHSTDDHPDRIDVKTGRALGILPPSTDKTAAVHTAKDAGDLREVGQDFIDAVYLHNGRDVPRIPRTKASTPKTTPVDLDQKMRELNAMLDHIDPDLGYEDWLHVLMAIFQESGGTDDGFAIANEWSGRGSKYCGERELRTKWSTFANYSNTPITVATIRKRLTDDGIDWEEVCAATGPQFKPCKTEVIHPDTSPPTAPKQSASPLEQYSLRGMSSELEKQAVDDVFVLPGIALMGESTVLFGAPGSAKTLSSMALLIESINAGTIDPDRVFYVNVDDNLKGLTQKLRIAEEYGFHMLAEGHRNFRASDLRDLLNDAITNGHADGIVVVLDTLKKFTNLMDKTKASAFTALIRQFVVKGGTVIALAHTNKNPGPDGKPKYGGTTDVVEDVDCAYVIDVLDDTDPTEKVVVFENIKSRGDNAQQACYRYSVESGQSYEVLLASVEPIEGTQLLMLQREAELKSDAAVINAIVAAIQDGVTTKMKLADAAAERAGCSKRAALKIVEKYTGTDPSRHRWSYEVRERGAKVYALLADPEPTPS